MSQFFIAVTVVALFFWNGSLSADSGVGDLEKADLVKHGRYLSIVAGCNDCHTPRFAETGGEVPEHDWLTGVPVGWKGPWGTTYAINIRALLSPFTLEQWIAFARASKARPPMPSYVFRTMTDRDLTGLYYFIRSLGAAGEPMPVALPPGEKPKTAYMDLEVQGTADNPS